MSSSSTYENETPMTFEKRHTKTLNLLELHKEEIEDYEEIVQSLTTLYEKCTFDHTFLIVTIQCYTLYLLTKFESKKGEQWIKENKFLSGVFE